MNSLSNSGSMSDFSSMDFVQDFKNLDFNDETFIPSMNESYIQLINLTNKSFDSCCDLPVYGSYYDENNSSIVNLIDSYQ